MSSKVMSFREFVGEGSYQDKKRGPIRCEKLIDVSKMYEKLPDSHDEPKSTTMPKAKLKLNSMKMAEVATKMSSLANQKTKMQRIINSLWSLSHPSRKFPLLMF